MRQSVVADRPRGVRHGGAVSRLRPERRDAGAGVPASMLAVGVPQRIGADHLVLPRTGLQLPANISLNGWLALGVQLSVIASSSAWCLGDWLIYGEDVYPGRYRDAIEQTSLDYKTLRNYAWVARRFSVSRRRDTLSFGHHAEVAALPRPEQDYWLRKAEELGWSRNHTRREVRASLAERDGIAQQATGSPDGLHGDDGPPAGEGPGAGAGPGGCAESVLLVKLKAEELEACKEAASQGGYSVQNWAALTLYRVARRTCNLVGRRDRDSAPMTIKGESGAGGAQSSEGERSLSPEPARAPEIGKPASGLDIK